jgi:hypothetical protein
VSLAMGFLGVLLLAAVVVGWHWLHRSLNEDGGVVLRKKERVTDRAAELEAFIAAYRSGKISANELQSPAPAAPASPQPAEPSLASPAAAQPVKHTPASPVLSQASAPAPFMRPQVKVAYLTLRAGLRDHHVFLNVHLSDLGKGTHEGRVDLLVCTPAFEMIAAIDVLDAGEELDPGKAAFLADARINYLTMSPGSFPKPAEIRGFVYRAAS